MDAFRAAIARDPVCVSEGVYQVDQADQPVTARGKGKGRKRGNRAGKSVRQLAHRYPPIPEHGTIAWYRSELRSYQMYCLVLERRTQLAQDDVVQLEQQSRSSDVGEELKRLREEMAHLKINAFRIKALEK
jgi:hypothetical protein